MAIPTWRNVNAPSNTGANQLLSSAGNTVSQGISNITSAIGNYEDVQANNQAKQFQDTLSAGIQDTGGDPQAYRDFVTQEVAANPNLSPEERISTIDNAVQEQEALTGLTANQQQLVAQEKARDAVGLQDLEFQQKAEERTLEASLDYPLERFGWQDDTSLAIEDVQKKYAGLGESGLPVEAIRETAERKLGRPITGKELQGFIIDAGGSDWSPFNDNAIEVGNTILDKLFGDSLDQIVDKYAEGIGNTEDANKVRKFKQDSEKAKIDFTTNTANKIAEFGKQARKINTDVLSGAARSQVNF